MVLVAQSSMKSSNHPHDKREDGFTLMETSIAFVLLMIVGLGAASLFFYAAINTSTANDRQLAMAVAQQRVEELRSVLFTDASLTATAGTDANVTSAGRPYKVRTVISDGVVVNGQPTIKTITLRVTPQGAGSQWTRTITSLFGSVTITTQRTTLLLGPNR
jgi:Tfp pilus assembly protein PilV